MPKAADALSERFGPKTSAFSMDYFLGDPPLPPRPCVNKRRPRRYFLRAECFNSELFYWLYCTRCPEALCRSKKPLMTRRNEAVWANHLHMRHHDGKIYFPYDYE
jgi:hypothetical protein